MASPIPVYVTDCTADCMVIAHQAQDAVAAAMNLATVGIFALVVASVLMIVGIYMTAAAAAYRA